MKTNHVIVVYVTEPRGGTFARVFTTKRGAEIYSLYIAKKHPESRVNIMPEWLFTTKDAEEWFTEKK